MKLFLLLFLFITSITYAQDKYIESQGRFWSKEDDSLVFIKNQLLYNAFVEALTKEMQAMGLDHVKFWEKYNQKFDESFKPRAEELAKKYGLISEDQVEQPSISADKKDQYQEELRRVKLEKKRLFGNLSTLIRSFAIKKMSRSPQHPQSRYILVESKIDRVALNKLYYQYMREQQSREFTHLYLIFDYELENASWSELGVDSQNKFTDVVNDAWMKWFEQNLPSNIKKLVHLKNNEVKDFQQHLNIEVSDLSLQVSSRFVNSLAFKVTTKIEKKLDNDAEKNQFNYTLGLVLYDLSTNRVLYKSDIKNKIKEFPVSVQDQLAHLMANYLYRLPFSDFSRITSKVKQANPPKSIQRLVFKNFKNVNQLLSFNQLLNDNGLKLRLSTQLSQMEANNALIIAYYQGDETSLSNLLGDVRLLAVKQGIFLKADSLNSAFDFTFVESEEEINKPLESI